MRPLDILYQWVEQELDTDLLPMGAPMEALEAIAARFGDNPRLEDLLAEMEQEERAIYDLILCRVTKPTKALRTAVALAACIAYQRGMTVQKGDSRGGLAEPAEF